MISRSMATLMRMVIGLGLILFTWEVTDLLRSALSCTLDNLFHLIFCDAFKLLH